MSDADGTVPPDRRARIERLIRDRDLKMARSAQRYVRGSTAQFYTWLAQSKAAASAPRGPAVWICGDCHVGNLGPIAGPDGGVEVQIRDLDQTVIGDPAHDLIRLALSLAMAARSADLPGVITARMLEAMVEGYSAGLDRDGLHAISQTSEPAAVAVVRREALGRKWRHLAEERIADTSPVIPLGSRFWPLSKAERKAVKSLVESQAVVDLVLALAHRPDSAKVRMVDAAYWKKGCSSLGHLRYAALMRIDDRESGRSKFGLLDIKEALPSVAPAAPGAQMPATPGERVAAGALALSPNLGERIAPAQLLGRSVFVRELLPQDLKIELAQFGRGEAVKAARYLAAVVGRAHGRQMTPSVRAAWLQSLAKRHTGGLEAPNWLWSAVVELAAMHEAGYLEHCRRYALNAA